MRRTVQPASASGSAFQSTHPSGVRPELRISSKNASLFQSTHPSGVRLVAAVLAWFGLDISIHAPQWGATWMRLAGRCSPGFQSTHPSGVRPRSGRCQPARPRISIHAPQWGATGCKRGDYYVWLISIHAPQWGATRNGVSDAAYRCYFNPRTPVGCDDRRQGEHHRPGISIHAPQWGATCPSSSLLVLVIVFQSTHPSGVRPPSGDCGRSATADFNPRTPVGCDTKSLEIK